MCIIAYAKDRELTYDEFKECWTSNKDGFGMAFLRNGRIVYRKGIMDMAGAWEEYMKSPKVNVILHFRIATSGGVNKPLTHPFLISRSGHNPLAFIGETPVLFHNGILSGWEGTLAYVEATTKSKLRGNVSDTRAMAYIIANAGGDHDVTEAVLGHGKAVIVSKEGVEILGEFVDEKGVLFSNRGYVSYHYTTSRKYDWKNSYGLDGYEDWNSLYGIPQLGNHSPNCQCSECVPRLPMGAAAEEAPSKASTFVTIEEKQHGYLVKFAVDIKTALDHKLGCICEDCVDEFAVNNLELCEDFCPFSAPTAHTCVRCIKRKIKKGHTAWVSICKDYVGLVTGRKEGVVIEEGGYDE